MNIVRLFGIVILVLGIIMLITGIILSIIFRNNISLIYPILILSGILLAVVGITIGFISEFISTRMVLVQPSNLPISQPD